MAVGISVLPIFIICLLLTCVVVIFVSKDAAKRNMNPLVWALVAAFAPFFLGLIIYLICRNPLVDLQCPKCGAGISQYDKICPKCGSAILTQCPNCDFPVQKGWNACPSCGTEFPKEYSQPVRSYKKDNGLVAVIIVVVLALLALFVSVFVLWRLNSTNSEHNIGYGGFEGMYNISEADMAENQAITEWIQACKNSKEKVHVLVSNSSDTLIVYIPNSKYLMRCDASLEYKESTEECYLCFYVENAEFEDTYGYDFFLYELKVEISDTTVKDVFIDGKYYEADVTFTDADISWETWRDGYETE